MNTLLFILPLAGLILGWTIRWLYARFQLSSAEQKAARIIQEAQRDSEVQKKELLLETKDHRFLSVIDHQPICMSCKKEEEKRPDYEDASRQMMAQCIAETNKPYGDPASYCFHHFCPFKCS